MKKLLTSILTATLLLGVASGEPDLKHFHSVIPGMTVESFKPSVIEGIYELKLKESPTPVYISNNGRYMLEGQAIDLVRKVNITQSYLNEGNKKLLAEVKEEEMIIYRSPKEEKVVTIFTDIDCPFCKMLHKDLDKYLDEGITIRYLGYPFMGLQSPSAETLGSIWCSDDRNQAFNDAMLNDKEPKTKCKRNNPVVKQFELGRALNVQGTPAIFTEEGELIPGYVPAKELRKMLD